MCVKRICPRFREVSRGFEVGKVGVGDLELVKPGTACLWKNLVVNVRSYALDMFFDGCHSQ